MTGKKRNGCIAAFVEYEDPEKAAMAISALDGKHKTRAGYWPLQVRIANASHRKGLLNRSQHYYLTSSKGTCRLQAERAMRRNLISEGLLTGFVVQLVGERRTWTSEDAGQRVAVPTGWMQRPQLQWLLQIGFATIFVEQ